MKDPLMDPLQLRTQLVARLAEATARYEHATSQLGQPYSDATRWQEERAHAAGEQKGLAVAVESLDRVARQPA